VVDPQTQQVRVSISVPTDGSRLLLGQTVSGRISLEGRASMLIPERAVDRTTDTAMVAILRQGRVVRMAVALGQRVEDTHHIEVVSGLTSGDSILIGEARRLATGTIVQSRRR
jgi:multidrug efflux pump subunit AcrA (membrane-fusion protein)